MRFHLKRNILAGTLALGFIIFLSACARSITPPQQIIVITAPGVAIARATYTPGEEVIPAIAPASTLLPCTAASAAPCLLVSNTPEPSPAQPIATRDEVGCCTPTPTHTLTPFPSATATPARAADAPSLSETTISLEAYAWHDHLLDTQPDDPVYPYPRLDYDPFEFDPGATRTQTVKGIVLENKYVRLTFLPEFGGRLYRWVDKTTGRQLLYNNPVIKATGFGVRGWWLSIGGLEWGLPIEDHGLVEWVPWHYATHLTPNTAAVIFSIAEERTGLECAIRIELDSTHSYFTLTPVLHNPTPDTLAYQFWLAALAAPAGDNHLSPDLHFNVPVESMLVHSSDDQTLPAEGQTIAWPVYEGRDLSRYGNWREFLSLFAFPGASQSYVGLHTTRGDQGLLRIFPPQIARGLKLFGPGDLAPFTWTDDDSSYVELWGGLTANFAENTLLQPGESLTWTEYWYPFHGIGNFVWANRDMALAMEETSSEVTVRLYTTSAQTVSITLFVNNEPVARWTAVTPGPGAWQAAWARATAGAMGVVITDPAGNTLTRYGQTP